MPAFTSTNPDSPDLSAVTALSDKTAALKKIGSFAGLGAEISTYDPISQQLFIISGGATLQVLSLSNPSSPSLVQNIDLSAFGTANSVAVKNGLVAVAVESSPKTAAGKVVFFDALGTLQGAVTVGALPDMLTFTPDGKKILVANEGEPNSYKQADSVDPVGSVSIIDLSHGVAAATVATAGFESFNSQIDALKASGVRIFGPNATVAQDLEPEYITVSADGSTAYVTLQENNALAVVDIASATVTAIKPLGLKNHNQPTVLGVETYAFTDLPTLGTTAAGQDIPLGGFSGLTFEGYTADGKLKFITHTDRGPNAEATGVNRPFLLPEFAPEVIRFELDRTTGSMEITQRIQLKVSATDLLSGLPNTAIAGGNGNTTYNDEVPVDSFGNVLPLDPLGADLEGIVVAADGSFWMVDEYRPAIYHFSTEGVLIDRFVPQGTAAAAGQPAGTFGTEALPEVLAQRRQNRGFEAIALQDDKIYAFVQSPIRNPESLSNGTLNGLKNVRIVEFDPATQTTRQFLYVMDNPPSVSSTDTRADKIGDAVAIGNGEFLVVERDDDAIDSDPLSQIQKKVYRFSLQGATEISSLPETINGKTLDQMTAAELAAAGVVPIQKELHVDLATAGYNTVEKVEGLTLIDRNTLAVINDNDFTVGDITFDPTDGTFTRNSTPETPLLGLITLQNTGLDASDKDGGINIRQSPVLGMYQPDAIASYSVGGQTYLITANEGDARDYDGFEEEERVKDLDLDPTAFPNAKALQKDASLGRLTVTSANGDTDGDGDFDQLQVFGARSFSIWDASGNLVFDSGDQIERITAAAVPSLFNSNGDTGTVDSRSDNKGPEPEGVVIGVVNNRTYAFIGLERTGGVLVYDVTDPRHPSFLEYVATEGDIAPEGLAFIPANLSPNGKSLLVVTNEVSKTTSIFEFVPPKRIEGTDDGDCLHGTHANDLILGHAGDDYLQGGNGSDRLYAGLGNDHLDGGNGDDLLAGGFGDDYLVAGNGKDILLGEAGDDGLDGGAEDDVLDGGSGNDDLTGGSGNDKLFGGTGNDKLQGDSGNDILDAGDGDDCIFGGSGNDQITAGKGEDEVRAGSGDDLINGGDGADTLYGESGNDQIVGGAGDDLIYAGSGNDRVDGGLGDDTIWLQGGRDTVILRQGDGADTIHNFRLGQSSIGLANGLTFADLTITQGCGIATIQAGTETLAVIQGIRATALNNASNFTLV